MQNFTIAGRTAKVHGLVEVLALHIDGIMHLKVWPGQEKLLDLFYFTCFTMHFVAKIERSQFSLRLQEKLRHYHATSTGQVMVKFHSCHRVSQIFRPPFVRLHKP